MIHIYPPLEKGLFRCSQLLHWVFAYLIYIDRCLIISMNITKEDWIKLLISTLLTGSIWIPPCILTRPIGLAGKFSNVFPYN